MASSVKYSIARDDQGFDFSYLSKHLVLHKAKPKMLYCRLTHANVNLHRDDVEKHIEGKRFKTKVYETWKKVMLKI